MSVICHNFVQNTWKKDLCSNCFKSSAEHNHAETKNNELLNFINGGVTNPLSGSNGEVLGRYMSQATTIYQSRSLQARAWPSLIIDQKSATKGHNISMKLPATCLTEPINPTNPLPLCETEENPSEDLPADNVEKDGVENEGPGEAQQAPQNEKKEAKPTVRFHEEEVLVIGYGGNDYDPSEPAWEMNSDGEDDWVFETMDNTTEERILTRMTKENTEFNSDNSNLLKDPAKEEEVHCLNVKNAISMLEGRSTKKSSVVAEKEDASSKVRTQPPPATKPVPEVTKLETADIQSSSNPKSSHKESKKEAKIGTAKINSAKVEENKQKTGNDQKVREKEPEKTQQKVDGRLNKDKKPEEKPKTKYQEKPDDFPVYSVVTKPPKTVEVAPTPQVCTCPDVLPQSPNEIQDSSEPYYKIPTANNRTVVPEDQVAEFPNYDVPNRTNPDANEHNFIDEQAGPHYDVVRHENDAAEDAGATEQPLSQTTDLPPELPTTPPPSECPLKNEKCTSEQIAEQLGITPTAQSSFLHNPRTQDFEKCNTYKEEDNSLESDCSSKDSEEVTTTTNPIYTPTNVGDSSDSDYSAIKMSKSKPKIPVKPSNLSSKSVIKPNSDSDCSAKSDDGYDAVEYPQGGNSFNEEPISSQGDFEIYQDVATAHQQLPSTDKNAPVESELSKQRSGSSKRQAPPPPRTVAPADIAPSPAKKPQRHSMTFPSAGSSTPSSKPKSCTLGGFHRIRIGSCKSPEDKEQKPRKGKFWKKILNRFSRDGDSGDCGKHGSSNDVQKTKLSKTPSDSSAKKVRLQIIHPIDFEQSGGPQIIESPAITTAEDGMPSVIDCASPASSICSGTSPVMSDDNATSSDSGGNYESVGEDEDSSTGHNGYASQDEQSSDYFEASQSDSSGGEMYQSTSKPHAPVRTKSGASDSRRSHAQPPNRPPPPKISNNSTNEQEPEQNGSAPVLSQNYANSKEIQAAMAAMKDKPVQPLPGDTSNISSDEETKRRRAPSPPKKNSYSTNEDQHTYQNVQQVKMCVDEESAYYEPLEITRGQSNRIGGNISDNGSSSPAPSNSLETVFNSNDAKSTDSGFIDFSKSKSGTLSSNNQQNDGGHLYEKIESSQSSPRSISPEDTMVRLRERQRNSSGFSDNSFKVSCKRLASLTLEENYGNIVCTNHETLACILENVQRVKTSHPFLSKAGNLKWQDFDLESEEPLLSFKRSRAMFRANYRSHPDTTVTLMISKDGLCLSPPGNAPFIIHPLVQFTDTIPAHLFSGKESCDQSTTVSASIWVLDNVQAYAIPSLSLGIENTEEKRIFFIMLQLITALKFLQAHGIEELDSILDSFLVNLTNNHLFIFGDSSVQPQHGRQREIGPKLSLCHAAISSMLYLLRESSSDDIIEISEESIGALNESKYALFSPIANVLIKEKAVSLSQAKSLLEYMLWGPPESSFDRQDFCSNEDLEIVIQRWLDQERANFLSNLVRTVNTNNVQSLQLSVYEEYKLIFLVRSSAKTLREASNMLEPEVTTF